MEEDKKIKALFPDGVETITISKNDYDRLSGELTHKNIILKKKLEELEKENEMLKNTKNNCPYMNTSGVKCQVKKLEAKNKRYERYLKNKDTEHEKVLRFIYDERDKDYISKSKIEDKVKELEKEADYRTEDNPTGRVHFMAVPVDYQIAILKSLLEE